MKFRYFMSPILGLVIIAGCSGDNSIVGPESSNNSVPTPSEMPGPPEYENPFDPDDIEVLPPGYIIVSYNAIPQTSGANCELHVVAFLCDIYARPNASPGIEVNFDVFPESVAVINHTVYTNDQGWVSAKLVYPSYFGSYDVQLVVSCHTVVDTFTIHLPVYMPRLELSADPQRLWANQPGTYDTSTVACRLIDGFGYPITGGRIVFVALVAGEICGPTYDYTDGNGWAFTQYRIAYHQIPDCPDDPSNIETAVRAALWGYPEAEGQVTILCSRP